MITERDTKIYHYNPKQDMQDANLVFESFDGADGNFNSFRAKTIIRRLSTELEPEARTMVVDGFHKILLGEETEWYILAIQPLPGTLRIRLCHYGAQIVDDYGEDEVDDKMTLERKADCKRVKGILGGYKVDLILSWEKPSLEDDNIWFALTMESGEEVGFEVDKNETTIEVSRGLFEGSIKHVLTWKNFTHTSFVVRKTHTFCL